jgi:N utilization substance protein A
VQAVVNELQGEKIDIIQWSPDYATFLVNALAPAEVTKVVMDEDLHKFEVVVPDDQLSLAIGRRGQNVRLASQLTGWDIDIMTESEESERRQEEMRQRSRMFVEALNIDEMMAQLLATEGFDSVDEIALVPADELAGLQGFDEGLAQALQARAQDYLARRDAEYEVRRRELGVDDEVAAIDGLTPGMLVALGEAGIKSLDDLGDLASDELLDPANGPLRGFDLSADEANDIIMAARAHWFDQEPSGAADEGREAPHASSAAES